MARVRHGIFMSLALHWHCLVVIVSVARDIRHCRVVMMLMLFAKLTCMVGFVHTVQLVWELFGWGHRPRGLIEQWSFKGWLTTTAAWE